MRNKPQSFAGIGGLIGVVFAAITAAQRDDFTVTAQMQQAVGHILGGLTVGAVLGYIIGRATDR